MKILLFLLALATTTAGFSVCCCKNESDDASFPDEEVQPLLPRTETPVTAFPNELPNPVILPVETTPVITSVAPLPEVSLIDLVNQFVTLFNAVGQEQRFHVFPARMNEETKETFAQKIKELSDLLKRITDLVRNKLDTTGLTREEQTALEGKADILDEAAWTLLDAAVFFGDVNDFETLLDASVVCVDDTHQKGKRVVFICGLGQTDNLLAIEAMGLSLENARLRQKQMLKLFLDRYPESMLGALGYRDPENSYFTSAFFTYLRSPEWDQEVIDMLFTGFEKALERLEQSNDTEREENDYLKLIQQLPLSLCEDGYRGVTIFHYLYAFNQQAIIEKLVEMQGPIESIMSEYCKAPSECTREHLENYFRLLTSSIR
ncbi:MAG: hypothetical protein A2Y14_00695 [Verrucomicrobia bacterium GWF2_51_19]|nr:MAG: hypothetical protein A2Y14_00695 [Verrucomicrobia bacterium GWF2_51_19]HCJ12438.1 hypothetical protein [Opitutae bacterium]